MLCPLATCGAVAGALTKSEPHPVIKYCVIMPTILEINQNSASPLGKARVKKPNIRGIIQIIILPIDCCCGSAEGTVDIFCSTHIEAATNTGRMKYPLGGTSGWARLSQRKFVLSGTAV
jgi:hypothetical protein